MLEVLKHFPDGGLANVHISGQSGFDDSLPSFSAPENMARRSSWTIAHAGCFVAPIRRIS